MFHLVFQQVCQGFICYLLFAICHALRRGFAEPQSECTYPLQTLLPPAQGYPLHFSSDHLSPQCLHRLDAEFLPLLAAPSLPNSVSIFALRERGR